MVIIELTYVADIADVENHLEAHREFLRKYYESEVFQASGPKNPRTGGIILAQAELVEVESLVEEDPFKQHGIAEYSLTEFFPTMTSETMAPLKADN